MSAPCYAAANQRLWWGAHRTAVFTRAVVVFLVAVAATPTRGDCHQFRRSLPKLGTVPGQTDRPRPAYFPTENRSLTEALTPTGRRVPKSIGHHTVRAFASSTPSAARRSSVNRSKVARVAKPTHVLA
jgi:hypothetical protein